ncbi:MAG: Mrp/NBP35 family ATP-binding protein, partial [Clostridia bacterium]
SLAVSLAKQGYKVGVLDGDITGPSVPKCFGITGNATGDGNLIYPSVTPLGIKIMSINLLLETPETPVVWRGPVIANALKQFWTDVVWGELDFLFIDMPPGTGDVPLTAFQSLTLDGIIIVTSPQALVSMIVSKAINMADLMKVKVLGIIENYSYLLCPNCKTPIYVFGKSNIDEIASQKQVPVLAKLALDAKIAEACDSGQIEEQQFDGYDKAIAMLKAL